MSSVVAQSVSAQNNNLKVTSLILTLGITRCCVFGKTLNANIPTSGGGAQWIRALVDNRKVVDFCLFVSFTLSTHNGAKQNTRHVGPA